MIHGLGFYALRLRLSSFVPNDLAKWGDYVLTGGMLRWIREEWQMASTGARVFFVLGVLVLLAGLLGLTYISRNWHAVPVHAGDTHEMEAQPNGEGPDDAQFLASRSAREQGILREYFRVMGGAEKLAAMKSVRATGEVSFPGGNILRVVVVKKVGGFIRFIIGVAPQQVVIGVNPEDAWQYSWVDGQEVVEDLDPSQLVTMRRSGHPVSKLFMAMSNEWQITYLGQKAFNYKMAHVFEVKIDEHETARFFIDPDSYVETGFEEWIIDDRGVVITRHVQSEHIQSDGILFPGKVETYINGELSHTFTVRQVEVNPGILNASFYRPKLEPAAPKP